MVFPRMNLAYRAANSGSVLAYDNEKVFGNEPEALVRLHDFNMCESLPVGAHFILALHDQYATIPQHPVCLFASILIQLDYGFVVFLLSPVARTVIAIMRFECRVGRVGRAPRRVHIRRVKYDAVYRGIFVRKIPAINSGFDIGGEQFVPPSSDISPEDALAEGNVRNQASRRDVEVHDMRERVLISAHVGAEDQFVGGLPILHPASF